MAIADGVNRPDRPTLAAIPRGPRLRARHFCGRLYGTDRNGTETWTAHAKERCAAPVPSLSVKSTARILNSGRHNYSCSGCAQGLINCVRLHYRRSWSHYYVNQNLTVLCKRIDRPLAIRASATPVFRARRKRKPNNQVCASWSQNYGV